MFGKKYDQIYVRKIDETIIEYQNVKNVKVEGGFVSFDFEIAGLGSYSTSLPSSQIVEIFYGELPETRFDAPLDWHSDGTHQNSYAIEDDIIEASGAVGFHWSHVAKVQRDRRFRLKWQREHPEKRIGNGTMASFGLDIPMSIVTGTDEDAKRLWGAGINTKSLRDK